jgi:hypothetical protein
LILSGNTWKWYQSLEDSSFDNYYYGTFTSSIGALRNNGWDYGTEAQPLYTFILTHEGQMLSGKETARTDQMQWVVQLNTLTGDLDVRNVTAASNLNFIKE